MLGGGVVGPPTGQLSDYDRSVSDCVLHVGAGKCVASPQKHRREVLRRFAPGEPNAFVTEGHLAYRQDG